MAVAGGTKNQNLPPWAPRAAIARTKRCGRGRMGDRLTVRNRWPADVAEPCSRLAMRVSGTTCRGRSASHTPRAQAACSVPASSQSTIAPCLQGRTTSTIGTATSFREGQPLGRQTNRRLVRSDWIVAGHAPASAEAHEQLKTLPSDVSHGDILHRLRIRDPMLHCEGKGSPPAGDA
jgi:hypothetical protein